MVGLGIHLELVHLGEELSVVARLLEVRDEQLHGFNRREWVEHAAQHEDALQVLFRNQQLFLARPRSLDVDRREDALVHKLAVENDFHVAGALELFEDDFIHARSGIDQGRRNDSQRAAFFDSAGRAEEALRALQRVGIHAA